MTFYTGDMVTHVPSKAQLSQAFVENVEDALLQMFQAYIGGPVYAALGNHDSSPENNDAPHKIDNDGPLGRQFSWNYDHISRLWEHYGWINSSTQAEAALHYGAYAVTHPLGVRIITLNSDFYYKGNYYAFLHVADPDYSGIFTFLINELQKAEDTGQRAYIISHVLTGCKYSQSRNLYVLNRQGGALQQGSQTRTSTKAFEPFLSFVKNGNNY